MHLDTDGFSFDVPFITRRSFQWMMQYVTCCNEGLGHQFHEPSFLSLVPKQKTLKCLQYFCTVWESYEHRAVGPCWLFFFNVSVTPSKVEALGNNSIHRIYGIESLLLITNISRGRQLHSVTCCWGRDSCSSLQESPMDECNRYIFWSVYGSFYVRKYLFNAINDCVFFFLCFGISSSVLYCIMSDPINAGK